MIENEEIKFLRNAVLEFIQSECEKENDVLKIWKKGFSLGYFDLSALRYLEVSTVFLAIHEVCPEVGFQLLYLTISNHLFNDFASFSITTEDGLITDWVWEKYVLLSENIKLIKASPDFLTTETFRLKNVEIIEERKSNISSLINLLLASRCVGTGLNAYKLALRYLKETKMNKNYYHCFEKLGEILVELKACELLTKASAFALENGDTTLSEMALWKSATTAVMAVDEAVIIQEGVYKFREDFKIEIFRHLAKIKHRNPKIGSLYDLKISEMYYPATLKFYFHSTPKF